MGDSETDLRNRSNTAEEWVRKAQQIISFLLSEAALVQAFKGRWMVISGRLHQLSAAITTARDLPCFGDSIHVEAVLPQIVCTLEEGKELAKRSIELNYGGKLLMQSNLDALATKLDLHLRNLHLRAQNGIVHETSGTGICMHAKKEADVWDLFAKLNMGNMEFKKRVLDSLIAYLKDDDKWVMVVAKEGDFSRLIGLLDSSVQEISEKAAEAVAILVKKDACKQALMAEGAEAPLMRLLECGSLAGKKKAAEALQGLSMCSPSMDIIPKPILRENAACIPLIDPKDGSNSSETLSALLFVNGTHRRELCKESSISKLLQLLDPRRPNIAKKFPMSAILALSGTTTTTTTTTTTRHCRKRVTSAAAAPRQHLEKLADMDVPCPKKSLDKISTKKLLSLFNRHKS